MNKQLQQYELVDKNKLKKLMESEKISSDYQLISTKNTTLVNELNLLKDNYSTLSTNYAQEVKARQLYLNKLQDIEGNIRVFCRLRPRNTHDLDTPIIVEVEDDYTVKYHDNSN